MNMVSGYTAVKQIEVIIRELEKVFPNKRYHHKMTLAQIMQKEGEQLVIDYLKQRYIGTL